ncbi:MAG: hypothetical protein ACLR5G_04640 [Eubacteriales bacterium]
MPDLLRLTDVAIAGAGDFQKAPRHRHRAVPSRGSSNPNTTTSSAAK